MQNHLYGIHNNVNSGANNIGCDDGPVVDCQSEHWLRLPIPDIAYSNPFLTLDGPRTRIDFTNGWMTEINAIHCYANSVHDLTIWNDQFAFPWVNVYERSPEAVVFGFASHVRPAFARGTIVADSPSTQDIPHMVVVLEQLTSNGWSPVVQATQFNFGKPVVNEVSGYVDPTASVRFRAQLPPPFAPIQVRDVRLFVEQCVPDASRPGKCLGDP